MGVRNIKGRIFFIIIMVMISLGIYTKEAKATKDREIKVGIEEKEFIDSSLYISQQQIMLEEVMDKLVNKEEWVNYMRDKKGWQVYIDPRSGRPVSIVGVIPIIPGDGNGNNISLKDVSNQVGYEVKEINKEILKDLLIKLLKDHTNLLRVNIKELGEIKIDEISDEFWHVHMKRQVAGGW